MGWTCAEEKQLERLCGEKIFSAAQIAKQIPGKTRNAVIGKMARMKIVSKHPTVRNKNRNNKLKININNNILKKLPKFVIDDNLFNKVTETSLSLLDIRPHQCHWPVAEAMFCGLPIEQQSYCAGHMLVAYQHTSGVDND